MDEQTTKFFSQLYTAIFFVLYTLQIMKEKRCTSLMYQHMQE